MRNPKNILITGASSGLGEALALHYAAPGIVLGLTGRDAARLQSVAASCVAKGAAVKDVVLDVTDRDAMRRWTESFDREHPIDLAIANAGISGGTGFGSGESEEQVRRIFDVNVTGVFNTIFPVLDAMRPRGRGQVAIMASLAGFSGWPGAPAYGASKGGIRLYGEGLRGDLAGTGITLSVICPGFVESRMTAVNEYPMPFLMKPGPAAKIMADGLAAGRGRIAYPWQSYALAGFLGLLPFWLVSRILTKLPKKAALDA